MGWRVVLDIMDGSAPCTLKLSVRPDWTSSISATLDLKSRPLNLDVIVWFPSRALVVGLSGWGVTVWPILGPPSTSSVQYDITKIMGDPDEGRGAHWGVRW